MLPALTAMERPSAAGRSVASLGRSPPRRRGRRPVPGPAGRERSRAGAGGGRAGDIDRGPVDGPLRRSLDPGALQRASARAGVVHVVAVARAWAPAAPGRVALGEPPRRPGVDGGVGAPGRLSPRLPFTRAPRSGSKMSRRALSSPGPRLRGPQTWAGLGSLVARRPPRGAAISSAVRRRPFQRRRRGRDLESGVSAGPGTRAPGSSGPSVQRGRWGDASDWADD